MSLAAVLATPGSTGALAGTVVNVIVALTCDCRVGDVLEPDTAVCESALTGLSPWSMRRLHLPILISASLAVPLDVSS